MNPRSLNTLLVQRIETALGVPLSQQTQLARGKDVRAVTPPGKPVSIAPLESATHRTAFAQEMAQRTTAPGQFRVPHVFNAKASIPTGPTGPSTAGAPENPLATQSTRMQLSHVGRILYSLFEQFPKGAGPITSSRPLFVSAVMGLREQAVSRAILASEQSGLFGEKPATKAPAPTLPPIPASSTLSGALGMVLQQSVVQSGLFYEAQLIRALRGDQRNLEHLKEQPQDKERAQVQAISTQDLAEDEASGSPARAIVRQQLDVLANQVIQWQGQAWPNTPMRWELRPWNEFDPDWPEQGPESSTDDEQAPWCSNIKIDMPHLGLVNVKIWVKGQTTRLVLSPNSGEQRLAENVDQLHQRLEQAGVTPLQIDVVSNDEGAP